MRSIVAGLVVAALLFAAAPAANAAQVRRAIIVGANMNVEALHGKVEANGHTAKALLQRALTLQLRRLDRVQQLVLLRTGLGHAQSLCAALDSAELPDVVGTLAGEDTILIITPDVRRARTLVKRLEEMSKG